MGERKDLKDLLRDNDFTQKRIIDDLANVEVDDLSEERDLSRELRRSEGGDFIKNVFLGLLLVGIVVGSFWVSFLIGKKVLVPPVKNLQTFEIPVPKTLSQTDIDQAEPANIDNSPIPEREIKPGENTKKPAVAKTAVKKPVSKPVAAKVPVKAAVKTVAAKPGQLYKVVVGTYGTVSKASKVSTDLKVKGFSSFVKRSGKFFRVQAGAFDTKEKASPLVSKLKAKGYTPALVLE
jgi:hypothetical protein